MAPLRLNRQWLTWLSIYPTRDNISDVMRFLYAICPIIVLIGDLCGIAAGSAFFLSSLSGSIDLEKATYSLCQISGLVNMTYMMIVSLLMRNKISATVDALIQIHDECEY